MSNIYLHPATCHNANAMFRLCIRYGADIRTDGVGRAVLFLGEPPINAERHGNGNRAKIPHNRRQIVGVDLPDGPEAA